MINNQKFEEIQRFRQLWLIILFLIINAFSIFIMVKQVVFGNPVGNNPASNTGLIIGVIMTAAFSLFFLFGLKMTTKISQDGIDVRLFPFHLRYRHYNWRDISKCYVRQYKPIQEYGGWGIKGNVFKGEKAFNVSGNKGLQIEFNNGKKLLIGTQKPEEIKLVLQSLQQYVE